MDDGCAKWKKHSKAIQFCTDHFSKKEVELLCDVFIEKYKIKAKPQKYLKKIWIRFKKHYFSFTSR